MLNLNNTLTVDLYPGKSPSNRGEQSREMFAWCRGCFANRNRAKENQRADLVSDTGRHYRTKCVVSGGRVDVWDEMEDAENGQDGPRRGKEDSEWESLECWLCGTPFDFLIRFHDSRLEFDRIGTVRQYRRCKNRIGWHRIFNPRSYEELLPKADSEAASDLVCGSHRDMHVIVVFPSKSTSSIYYEPKNAPNKSEASTAKRQWKILSKVASDCGKS